MLEPGLESRQEHQAADTRWGDYDSRLYLWEGECTGSALWQPQLKGCLLGGGTDGGTGRGVQR